MALTITEFFADELSYFYNNNFSIIGRFLFLATDYENTFRAYLKCLATKYQHYFCCEIKYFKDCNDDIKKLLEKIRKARFQCLIDLFFDKIIKVDNVENYKNLFINAKNCRNFIAHELCIGINVEWEKDSFRTYLQDTVCNECSDMVYCTLLMKQLISAYNKEPPVCDIENSKERILKWAVSTVE